MSNLLSVGLQNARILITGCAGFIGFHLASSLQKKGLFVIGFDNFNDYYSPKLKEDRESELAKCGIRIIKHDLCDEGALETLIETHEITHIVHLAAQAGVRYSLTHPDRYIHSNIEGFLRILEACKKNRHIKLVYASSSSVYGRNKKIPFAEEDRTDEPANMYGVTKKTKELMASTYNALYKISVVGLRFFTVYGPWGRPDMAYYSFTKKILAGEPIDLFNFGDMRRDFTYIDDIIQGIEASLVIENGNHIFNLGNNKPVSLHDLVASLEIHLGKKAKKNLLPIPDGEIIETYASIEKAKSELGFLPKTSIDEGIGKFIEWYQRYSVGI